MTIYFYSKVDEYSWLSNFSRHGFECDGVYWRTVEHYFQAAKFFPTDPDYAERIRLALDPKKARSLGRSRKHPLRDDWEAVKDDIMRLAVRRKFETHSDLCADLLATDNEELVEKAPNDYYWGSGRTGSGKNMLGVIVMEVRQQLRKEESN